MSVRRWRQKETHPDSLHFLDRAWTTRNWWGWSLSLNSDGKYKAFEKRSDEKWEHPLSDEKYWLVGDNRNLPPNFNVVQISFWIMCWHFNKEAKKGNSYLSDVDNDRPSSERTNLAAQFSEMSVAAKQSKMKLWSSKVDKIEKLCQNFFW